MWKPLWSSQFYIHIKDEKEEHSTPQKKPSTTTPQKDAKYHN